MEPGNENGYLVGLSMCPFPDDPVRVNKGDVLRVESLYQSNGDYGGVMGLFYIAAHRLE